MCMCWCDGACQCVRIVCFACFPSVYLCTNLCFWRSVSLCPPTNDVSVLVFPFHVFYVSFFVNFRTTCFTVFVVSPIHIFRYQRRFVSSAHTHKHTINNKQHRHTQSRQNDNKMFAVQVCYLIIFQKKKKKNLNRIEAFFWFISDSFKSINLYHLSSPNRRERTQCVTDSTDGWTRNECNVSDRQTSVCTEYMHVIDWEQECDRVSVWLRLSLSVHRINSTFGLACACGRVRVCWCVHETDRQNSCQYHLRVASRTIACTSPTTAVASTFHLAFSFSNLNSTTKS